jgi:hypothetical protein
MLPEASREDLLYVANVSAVSILSFPQGKGNRSLKGIGGGSDCADKSGNVFITNRSPGLVYEYAQGGAKRVRTLQSDTAPLGCAVDPRTGNLAVANGGIDGRGQSVRIFKGARGAGTTYTDSTIYSFAYCAYDDMGNLFVDGFRYPGGTGDFIFAELPKNAAKLTIVRLNVTLTNAGGVQWDGRNVVVGDRSRPFLYRFRVNGDHGIEVGKTALEGPNALLFTQFSIVGETLVQPQDTDGRWSVRYFRYPGGGHPTKIITTAIEAPLGVVVSPAK